MLFHVTLYAVLMAKLFKKITMKEKLNIDHFIERGFKNHLRSLIHERIKYHHIQYINGCFKLCKQEKEQSCIEVVKTIFTLDELNNVLISEFDFVISKT